MHILPTKSINPDEFGYFGDYGGMFIPEILHTTFEELISAFYEARRDPNFWQSYVHVMQNYSCRPTPVTSLENFAKSDYFITPIIVKDLAIMCTILLLL